MSLPPLHTAHLPNGLHLAYLDSFDLLHPDERPEEYTTVVGLHGVGFNSAVWTPLLPHLPPSIRFLAYNQRSYAGSSPAFSPTQPGGVDAMAAYVGDLMQFVGFAVQELGVREKKDGGEGGIVLLGWSKGTTPLISLLSLLHIPSSSSSAPSSTSFAAYLSQPPFPSPLDALDGLLASHLRSILLFEPPGSAFGRPPTADYTEAMAAVSPPNTSSPEEFAEAFAGWIGQYSGAADGLPASGLAALSPEVLEAAWEPACVAHGFAWRVAAGADEVGALARLALAPPGGEVSLALPVGFVYGARTVEYCLDAKEVVRGWWEGEKVGRTAMRCIEGTNHFAFVHRPREFAQAVQGLIRELA
ncbi:hypothetical protein JCM10207_007726 [Rhodosporidiobolus poonsookiae]